MSFIPSLYCVYKTTKVCQSSLHQAEQFLYFEFPGIIFASIELSMVSFFWIVNHYVDSEDFTKAYVTVLMYPLSLSTIMKLWTVSNNVGEASLALNTYGDISYFVDHMYGALITGSQLYIMMGTVGLALLLIVTVVQQKRSHEKEDTWVGFCTMQLVALSLGTLNYFLDLPYHGLPRFAIALTVFLTSIVLDVFILVALITLIVIFLTRRKSLSKDRLVRDGKERLLFAVFASALMLPPCYYSLLHISSFNSISDDTTMDDDARAEWVLRILQFITGPIVIPAIFLLRPYHMAVVSLFNRKKMSKKTTPFMTTRIEEATPAIRPEYPTNPTYPPTDPTFQTYPPHLLYPPATPSQLSRSAKTNDSTST